MGDCYFCEEGKDFMVAKRRLGHLWPYENEVVFYDESVFAIAGASPQVVPYVLILPYRHIYSTAEMTQAEKNSFQNCLKYLCGRGGYGKELCVFEHGGKSEDGSSSIDHCHIHVIDGKYGLYYQKRYGDFQVYKNEIPEVKGSYLMVGRFNSDGLELKITTNHIAHERQYFRRRLAEIICDKQWDWHEDDRIDKMIETMKGFVDPEWPVQ